MVYGIRGLEETPFYQEIFQKGYAEGWVRGFAEGWAKGRLESARKILILCGSKMFGPPDWPTEARIAALTDLDRLEGHLDRIPDVASWDDLLSNPSTAPE